MRRGRRRWPASWPTSARRRRGHGLSARPPQVAVSEASVRRRPGNVAFLDDREVANRIVVEVDVDRAVFGLAQLLDHAQHVGCIRRGRLPRETRGGIRVADDGHAVAHQRLAGHGQLAVTLCSAAMFTITLPGFIDCTISAVMSFGTSLPGISAVVMMMSASLACCAYIARCVCWKPSLMTWRSRRPSLPRRSSP